MGIKDRFSRKKNNEAEAGAPEQPKTKGQKRQKKQRSEKKGFKLRLPSIKKPSTDAGASQSAEGGFAAFAEEGGFDAKVRSSEPILKVSEADLSGGWKDDILLNTACGALIAAFLSVFCAAAELPEMIPYVLPCLPVFIGLSMVESVKPGKIKWIASAVIAVILAVTMAIWHSRILGGLAYTVNQFYDIAEEAQAYIYNRFSIGDLATDTDMKLGAVWVSCALGLLAALPPLRARRSVGIAIAVIAMFAFAYYGLIPSWACIAALLAALILTCSRGNVISILPIALAALLVFGAVILIDPGENYGISRMDENFRDRFALKSAYLESNYMDYDDFSDFENTEDSEWENESSGESVLSGEYAKYAVIGVIALLIGALAALAFLQWKRMSKKRELIRAGIESEDAAEAVRAMFPYSVRWLKSYEGRGELTAFTELIPAIKNDFPGAYAERYSDMYGVWSEAAYSDHEVSEEKRSDMSGFMHDTIDMIQEKCSFKEKLRLIFKYALWEKRSRAKVKKPRRLRPGAEEI